MDRRKAGTFEMRGLLKTDLFRSRRMRRMRDSAKQREVNSQFRLSILSLSLCFVRRMIDSIFRKIFVRQNLDLFFFYFVKRKEEEEKKKKGRRKKERDEVEEFL